MPRINISKTVVALVILFGVLAFWALSIQLKQPHLAGTDFDSTFIPAPFDTTVVGPASSSKPASGDVTNYFSSGDVTNFYRRNGAYLGTERELGKFVKPKANDPKGEEYSGGSYQDGPYAGGSHDASGQTLFTPDPPQPR